jgi:hypothetical protein
MLQLTWRRSGVLGKVEQNRIWRVYGNPQVNMKELAFKNLVD